MIESITVLGAGTMGRGIAQLFAKRGFAVSLYDPNTEVLSAIEKNLHTSVVLFSELVEAVTPADLIIEAAPEQLEIKRQLYARLASCIKNDAIVASNTSTYSLESLAENQPFRDRMMITHFFNPAHLIPLVEIVGLPSTPSSVISEVMDLLRLCGRTPVLLNRDIPGFIANRLQAALMREACYLLDTGVANADQIDTVVKEGLGLRWAFKGPFEIADLGGLDIWSKVTGHLFPTLSISDEAPQSITAKVADGELGVKRGQGFYRYEDAAAIAADMHDGIQKLVTLKKIMSSEDESL